MLEQVKAHLIFLVLRLADSLQQLKEVVTVALLVVEGLCSHYKGIVKALLINQSCFNQLLHSAKGLLELSFSVQAPELKHILERLRASSVPDLLEVVRGDSFFGGDVLEEGRALSSILLLANQSLFPLQDLIITSQRGFSQFSFLLIFELYFIRSQVAVLVFLQSVVYYLEQLLSCGDLLLPKTLYRSFPFIFNLLHFSQNLLLEVWLGLKALSKELPLLSKGLIACFYHRLQKLMVTVHLNKSFLHVLAHLLHCCAVVENLLLQARNLHRNIV